MVTDFILFSLLLIVGAIGVVTLITLKVIELIKDIKGDTVGDRVKLLKDLGYEVEIENGTIFIILPEKDYYNRYFRKGIDEIMSDYSKSYGIRLKDGEDDE